MNIFVTDPCPVRSAQALDDVRVNKMITESLQMLGYAMVRHNVPESLHPIKKCGKEKFALHGPHRNHPCSIWAGNSAGNFKWLLDHTVALVEEHWTRGKKGQEQAMKNCILAARAIQYMPQKPLQDFQNSSELKNMGDPVLAYRITMTRKWHKEYLRASVSHGFLLVDDILDRIITKQIGEVVTKRRIRRSQPPKWTTRGEPSWHQFIKANFNWRPEKPFDLRL